MLAFYCYKFVIIVYNYGASIYDQGTIQLLARMPIQQKQGVFTLPLTNLCKGYIKGYM